MSDGMLCTSGDGYHGCILMAGHDGPHKCCSCDETWEDE